eukprot:1193451-Amphidinium_carterae.1
MDRIERRRAIYSTPGFARCRSRISLNIVLLVNTAGVDLLQQRAVSEMTMRVTQECLQGRRQPKPKANGGAVVRKCATAGFVATR